MYPVCAILHCISTCGVVHAQLLLDSLIHSADAYTFSYGVGGLFMRLETILSLLKKNFY